MSQPRRCYGRSGPEEIDVRMRLCERPLFVLASGESDRTAGISTAKGQTGSRGRCVQTNRRDEDLWIDLQRERLPPKGSASFLELSSRRGGFITPRHAWALAPVSGPHTTRASPGQEIMTSYIVTGVRKMLADDFSHRHIEGVVHG